MVSNEYQIKLCDFGSATTLDYQPDNTWSVNKRNLLEEELAKQTTPMYRAPEMLDLYNNYRIDTQVDIWALGCVLFVLCFNKHPYEDAAKLRIINAKYQIPNGDKEFVEFHDLFRKFDLLFVIMFKSTTLILICLTKKKGTMFNTDPSVRPNINELMFHLENICQTRSIHLVENLTFLKKTESLLHTSNVNPLATNGVNATTTTTSATNSTSIPINMSSTANSWMGNALKGGNSLFKTIKDASSKVIDTVQSSINRTDLDMAYLTSRLCVMSCPTDGIESAAFGNNIDAIREALHGKHGKNYRIYNLASKTFRKGKHDNLKSTSSTKISLCKQWSIRY